MKKDRKDAKESLSVFDDYDVVSRAGNRKRGGPIGMSVANLGTQGDGVMMGGNMMMGGGMMMMGGGGMGMGGMGMGGMGMGGMGMQGGGGILLRKRQLLRNDLPAIPMPMAAGKAGGPRPEMLNEAKDGQRLSSTRTGAARLPSHASVNSSPKPCSGSPPSSPTIRAWPACRELRRLHHHLAAHESATSQRRASRRDSRSGSSRTSSSISICRCITRKPTRSLSPSPSTTTSRRRKP